MVLVSLGMLHVMPSHPSLTIFEKQIKAFQFYYGQFQVSPSVEEVQQRPAAAPWPVPGSALAHVVEIGASFF